MPIVFIRRKIRPPRVRQWKQAAARRISPRLYIKLGRERFRAAMFPGGIAGRAVTQVCGSTKYGPEHAAGMAAWPLDSDCKVVSVSHCQIYDVFLTSVNGKCPSPFIGSKTAPAIFLAVASLASVVQE